MHHHKSKAYTKGMLAIYGTLVLVMLAVFGVVLGTKAWLKHERELQTMTRVEVPILLLTGSNGQDATAIELGDVDVVQETEKNCVFGVKASQSVSYILQLAHTTNIPFTYEIFPAHTTKQEGDCEDAIEGYYYNPGTKLSGAYLNEVNGIADQKLHERTYGTYTHVQKNAEPLYWVSDAKSIRSEEPVYYVLHITWPDNLENNKETDMVYLTVGTASGSADENTGGGS